MATVSITIPDGRLQEIADFVALAKQYTGTDPIGQPETKNQFVRRMIIEQLKTWTAIGRKMEAEAQIASGAYKDGLGIT
jgi:hypothetical protein